MSTPNRTANPANRRRTLIAGVLGVSALAGGGYLAWRHTARRPPTSASLAASAASADRYAHLYALTLPDLAEPPQPQPLSRYRGRPLLVNFWATWCAPCVKEMPALDALAQRWPAVQFLGIGIDTAANMRGFVQKVPVAYPLLVAGYEGIDLLRALGNSTGGLPFTVVLDASGEQVQHILGEVAIDALEQMLARL